MKKQYMMPTFEVVEIKTEAHLLAGSDISLSVDGTTSTGFADSRETEDLMELLMN